MYSRSVVLEETTAVELQQPTAFPSVTTDERAGAKAQSVSLVRPRDLRKNSSLSNRLQLVPFGFGTAESTVPGNDPAIWIGNGLAHGVERAGYKIIQVDSLNAAQTPVVINAELLELSCAYPKPRAFVDVQVALPKIHIAVRVHVTKSRRVLSDSLYEADSTDDARLFGYFSTASCNDVQTWEILSKNALETLLAKAVPQITLTLHDATEETAVRG